MVKGRYFFQPGVHMQRIGSMGKQSGRNRRGESTRSEMGSDTTKVIGIIVTKMTEGSTLNG
jgi:hypothetical protein